MSSIPASILSAVLRALVHLPGQRSGASTITQQLARRLYLSDEHAPALVRKAHEMVLALQLEGRESKDEILAAYLNDVYYGRGAYGIEAAARVYFGLSAANLDVAHAAYLAGLPQLPLGLRPWGGPRAREGAPALRPRTARRRMATSTQGRRRPRLPSRSPSCRRRRRWWPRILSSSPSTSSLQSARTSPGGPGS